MILKNWSEIFRTAIKEDQGCIKWIRNDSLFVRNTFMQIF